MAILIPSDLNYVLSVSLSSRLIVTAVQFIFNILLADHKADAYRNKYYLALNQYETSLDIPKIYIYFYKAIEGLTKWDGQYFLEISIDGYVSEQHLAFLPLYPLIISVVKQFIFDYRQVDFSSIFTSSHLPNIWSKTGQSVARDDLSTAAVENYIRSAIVGYSLNNFIFFPLATLLLFLLTKLIKSGKQDHKYARNVIWWFCFNPASVFFSACYTESLFAVLTFAILFLVEYRAVNYQLQHHEQNGGSRTVDKFVPLSHLNKLLHIYLPSLAFLALSSATRSNGILTIGFLAYQFLVKYLPLTKEDTSRWSILYYIFTILEVLQDGLVLFMSIILGASGFITFQIFSYIRFCLQEAATSKGHLKPKWCDALIPYPYQYVQRKYWSVGPFQYYEFKQLPNFLLALPVTYVVLIGSLRKSKEIVRHVPGSRKQLAYCLQAIILTILCAICTNVQITTRLLTASCPIVYWIIADWADESRSKRKILTVYCISYFLVGIILHANFYPWT